MVSLIVLVSSGKGTFGYVNQLLNQNSFDKIYLICNPFSYEKFDIDSTKAVKLKYEEKKIEESFKKISEFLKKEIKDFEVALNIFSGTGIEHMALISAVLRAGLGVRFIYIEDKEIKEFEILEKPEEFYEDE
jgi:hypothetical protein